MSQVASVIITGHEAKTGTGQRGPWVLNIFTASDGSKYQTFDSGLAGQVFATMGQPVTVSFEPKQNGQFVNNELQSVMPGGVAAAAPASTPTAAAPASVQMTPVPVETNSDREIRIMRQSGLERSLMAFSIAGIDPLTNLDSVLELSDQFIDYFTKGRQAVSVVATAEPRV